VATLSELRQRRIHDCRLTPDRALQTMEDAEAFLRDRWILTLTRDSALPSLFAASHEEPYKAGAAGFGSWPRTKYPWAFELGLKPGIVALKVHRGKVLLCTDEALRAIDPLARAALAEADRSSGDDARLVRHLRSAGPSSIDDVKRELGLEAPALRKMREKLETVAAVVSRDVEVDDGKGGHRHISELRRWDQVWNRPWKANEEQALAELALIGVRAAVLTHQDEVGKWFSWDVEWPILSGLIAAHRLARPGPGFLAIA
jgi:hypothetical protein